MRTRGGGQQRLTRRQVTTFSDGAPSRPAPTADHPLRVGGQSKPEFNSDESEGPRFWTRDALRQVVERVLGRRHFIVVLNREPYVHRLDGEDIVCERPVSGLVTALELVMRAC